MTSRILWWVVAACAASVSLSWLSAARRGRWVVHVPSGGVVAWGACCAAAFAVGAMTTVPSTVTRVLTLAGTLAVVGTVSVVVRRLASPQSAGITLAEGLVTGGSLTTVFWCLAACQFQPGPEVDHEWAALAQSLLLVLYAALAALLYRLLFSIRRSVEDPGARNLLLVVLISITLLTLPHALALLVWLGVDIPVVLIALPLAVAFVGGAVAPWLEDQTSPPGVLTGTGLSKLPYVFVAAAIFFVFVRSLVDGVGPVTIVLLSIPVGSLVLALALALQENSRLLDEIDSAGQRLAALVENTNDVIARIDINGTILTVNAAGERLLRRRTDRLLGTRITDLVLPDEQAAVRAIVLPVAQGRLTSGQVELRLAPPASGTAELRLRGVEGGAVANLHDVTDAVRLRDRLERMARFDQMTGLANRTYLLEQVGSWLAEHLQVVVLYGDLDGFKGVNDRFGHHAGDAVLVEVAERLQSVVRSGPPHALVSRLGGDEFVIAIPQASMRLATQIARRWTQVLRAPFAVGGRSVVLGVSVGLASSDQGRPCQPTPHGAAELVHRADLAMFAAKTAGRGRVTTWTESLDEDAQRRVDIAIGLRRALATGRLAVAYQPIVRLNDGAVSGVEALVRVPTAESRTARPTTTRDALAFEAQVLGSDRRGTAAAASGTRQPPQVGSSAAGQAGNLDQLSRLVTPAELVAVAEEIGLIQEMGRWVLTESVRQAARLSAAGHRITVAVNISAGQLATGDFPEIVQDTLAQFGLPPEQLMFEITESRVVSEAGPTFNELCRLRDLGVRIAIDDFGTGYSALAYLRRLPVDTLKVDRALLEGVGDDPQAAAMLRAIIAVARALDLDVVVEGLEDHRTAHVVRELGATAGQGFVLSPALDRDQLHRLLDDVADGRRQLLRVIALDGSPLPEASIPERSGP